MYIQQVLLSIFSSMNGQRSATAALHLLRGKRSGQTIQDVGTFHLHKYFGILPKLSKNTFTDELNQLIDAGWVHINDGQQAIITARGKTVLQQSKEILFNGWYYRGNEHIFFKRLSLVVQTLSHFHAGDYRFMPLQKDEEIQHFVKQFLMGKPYKETKFKNQFRDELEESIQQLPLDDKHKLTIVLRITGYRLSGWTWQQLAEEFDATELDMQLILIESLHIWLDDLYAKRNQYPFLHQLAAGIRLENVLNDSTKKTADLYYNGYTPDQIAQMRSLKISTIEDHFVEMAMNDIDFPLNQFISEEDTDKARDVMRQTGSKKLKVIRESIPHLSYFQIRLVMATKGG